MLRAEPSRLHVWYQLRYMNSSFSIWKISFSFFAVDATKYVGMQNAAIQMSAMIHSSKHLNNNKYYHCSDIKKLKSLFIGIKKSIINNIST